MQGPYNFKRSEKSLRDARMRRFEHVVVAFSAILDRLREEKFGFLEILKPFGMTFLSKHVLRNVMWLKYLVFAKTESPYLLA